MEQHLVGTSEIGMLANPTGFGIAKGQALEGRQEQLCVIECKKNSRDKFAKDHNGFEQAAIGVVPKIKQSGPMKEQHREQFGINLCQDSPGVVRIPFIDGEIFFPEFEEDFNLPTDFEQEQDFFPGEQTGWYIG